MRALPSTYAASHTTVLRAGVTLSEVLISLMIMGIGIVGLASLFPVSVLKSVQATNLTNATNLNYNVRALRHSLSQVSTGAVMWQPNLTCTATAPRPTYVIPSRGDGRSGVPNVIFECTTGGVTRGLEPTWRNGTGVIADYNSDSIADVPSDTTVWRSLSLANGYVIDPLGSFRMEDSVGAGNFGSGGTPQIRRFSGGATTILQAQQLATLPDSWTAAAESTSITGFVDNGDGTFTVSFSDLTGLNEVVATSGAAARVVFFDADLREVHVRRVTAAPAGNSVTYRGELRAGFVPFKVRIENQELRYTWLTTTSPLKDDGSRNSQVAIFFRRQFNPDDEKVHGAIFDEYSALPDPSLPATDPSNHPSLRVPSSVVIVKYDPANPPKWKRGGFLLDYNELHWYRILEINEGLTLTQATPSDYVGPPYQEPFIGSVASYAQILVEGRVLRDSGLNPTPPSGTPSPTDDNGQVVFMPNIVDVFPLDPLSVREVR
jgi:hypothetical protein